MENKYNGYERLMAYQKAYKLANELFVLSKSFPEEEKYSLTDQVRRSSRSVCTNIGEGYRKRRYPKHFVSKLTDADGEMTETQIWINFAFECKYISLKKHEELSDQAMQAGRLIGFMIDNPQKFGCPPDKD
jgi:four helix bundle protein